VQESANRFADGADHNAKGSQTMAKAKPEVRNIEGEGYTATVTGSDVLVKFNMDKVLRLSASGKSKLSVSTGGFIPLGNGRKFNMSATIPLDG
jgi:hypothetical protein